MSKIEWLERRRRAARCKIHGLHYDPSMTSGCVLCRKQGLLREKPKGPQLIMLLLCLLGLAVVAFQIYGPVARTVSGLTSRQASTERPTTRSPAIKTKIDPESVRGPLSQFETALLAPKSDRLEDIRYDILTGAQLLAKNLRLIETSHGQNAATEVTDLADLADSENFDLRTLEKARHQWFEARARNFQPALWFRSPPRTDVDRAQIAVYREIATELQAMIADGAQQARDPGAAPAESWDSLQSNWTSRIAGLSQRLPERPNTLSNAQLLLAVQALEQSLDEMEQMTAAKSPPTNLARLDRLDLKVQDALRTLDSLLL